MGWGENNIFHIITLIRMDKQLSSNRDATDSGGSGGGGQQKRRRDGRPSNNMRPHNNNMNNNGNFNGNQQQGWNGDRQNERRDYGGRGGGLGRGPPGGRGGGRGFDNRGRGNSMNNMRGPQNDMRGPNDMRNNMNGPPQYQQQQGRGRGGNMPQHNQNNQGYPQQQQQRYDGQNQGRGFIPQQGRGDNNMTSGRGRGGDMSGRGTGRTQEPSQTDLQKSQTPIPPNERRTLILSNIPSTLKYHQIQNHLSSVLNVQVQYCTIDNNSNEAYVRFKYVNDAIKVWDGGTKGLDGNANTKSGNNSNGEGGEQISLVQLGVQLKAVHFTNFMIAQPKVVDRGQQSSGSSGRGSASAAGRGGEGRGFDRERKWDQHQGQSNGGDTPQSSSSPPAAAISAQSTTPNYPTNTKYHRSPSKQQSQQQKKLSPMEIQLQEQKQLEEQKAYEQFQIQEKEWRKRRKAEYDIFMTAKQSREAHLSTLEQKKDLLSKQESMLDKQLPLHKKMLTVLKSKNAELSEQSKKMKEILSTQTRVMEIKKEIMGLVETIEKLKQEEKTKGVFRPTEKRPIFSSVDTDGSSKKKKARLDRRTTVLKVEGFNNDVTEDAIKEHFKCCTSVNIETQDDKTFAIVNFANRVHAEKAKSSTTKFNDQELTCTWHNLPSTASTEVLSNQDQATPENGEESTDQAAKDDDMNVEEEEGLYDDFGGDVFDIEPPADGIEEENVDYDEDEDLVDYD